MAAIIETNVFIAVHPVEWETSTHRLFLFAGHAFQQGKPSFATAAPPLKGHGEVLVAFAGRDPHIFPHWPDKFQYLLA
jgi:hypothetical protein